MNSFKSKVAPVTKSFILGMLTLSFLSALLVASARASEDNTYEFKWLDPDKEVFVLQNRKYTKASKLYISLGAGITTSGAFIDGNALQGRVGFFGNESFGAELVYSMNSGSTNDTYKQVRSRQAVPLIRQVDGYVGGLFLWSPFYSKVNTFNKILYFDWIFGLGVAQLTEKNNKNALGVNEFEGLTKESHTGFMYDIALRFYVTQQFSIKADFTSIYFSAPTSSGTSLGGSIDYWHYDLTGSLVYSF